MPLPPVTDKPRAHRTVTDEKPLTKNPQDIVLAGSIVLGLAFGWLVCVIAWCRS